MTFKKLSAIALVIAACSLLVIKHASGRPTDEGPDLASLSDVELKALTINFERSRCYGSCPNYTVTIHGDGRVDYIGSANVKETGSRKGQIETATIRTLVAEFAQTKFFTLSGDYSEAKCNCGVCTDMPTATTELKVKSLAHSVKHYYGCSCAPKVLFDLESAIDKAANSEQWTGDVSKAGPFGTTCFDRSPPK